MDRQSTVRLDALGRVDLAFDADRTGMGEEVSREEEVSEGRLTGSGRRRTGREAKGGYTVLTGKIIDQPHLYGILDRINGLGLELLSVEALPDAVLTGPESKREQEEPEL